MTAGMGTIVGGNQDSMISKSPPKRFILLGWGMMLSSEQTATLRWLCRAQAESLVRSSPAFTVLPQERPGLGPQTP